MAIRDPKGNRQDDDNRDRYKDHDHDDDHPRPKEDNCKDGKTPTDKTLQRERKKVCEELLNKAADVRKWEETRTGSHQLYNDKKCCFIQTEVNYQYYRNMEIMVGIELMQVNDAIKENVTAYKNWNTELADLLKEIVTATKEAKAKFADLKEAGCKLNTCINDSCRGTEKKILTGESYDNCHDIDTEVEDKCNAKEILDHLEKTPKILWKDIDIIFNSATRVSGIQVFSNVSTLEPLQGTLKDKSKAFDDYIIEKMKKGAEDLKKGQEDLSKAVIELTQSTSGLYFRRGDYKGVKRATMELCECHCDCIDPKDPDGRLDNCKCKICDICDEVKTGVCKPEDNPACRNDDKRPETQSLTY